MDILPESATAPQTVAWLRTALTAAPEPDAVVSAVARLVHLTCNDAPSAGQIMCCVLVLGMGVEVSVIVVVVVVVVAVAVAVMVRCVARWHCPLALRTV